MTTPDGLVELLLVRHGQSTGNVASAAAEEGGLERIDIDLRDADVPLSGTGRDQARALGRWLRDLDEEETPTHLVVSPYVRAQETAQLAVEESGLDLRLRTDERIRDRELGVLDLLSAAGVRARFPEEDERRAWVGKFYYRPPGGESWADMALRVRSFLGDLERESDGSPRRALVVCHDAVIMLFRYVCEEMTEQEVLEHARTRSVTNASVTRLRRSTDPDGPRWVADLVSAQEHLETHGATATDQTGSADVG